MSDELKCMTPLPKDHPLLKLWEAYKATDDYQNTRRWALHDKHVDGSLWAAFVAGYESQSRELAELAKQVVDFKALSDHLQSRLDAYEKQVLPEEVSELTVWLEYEADAADRPTDFETSSKFRTAADLLRRLAHQQAASDKFERDLWKAFVTIGRGHNQMFEQVHPEHRSTIERL